MEVKNITSNLLYTSTFDSIVSIDEHKKIVAFLSSDLTSKSMASAFINGIESEKQTAGVKSTLVNAFKKISSQKIFMALSADEVPLNINSKENPAVISVVNNPKYESAYSSIIAMIMHAVIKQMSAKPTIFFYTDERSSYHKTAQYASNFCNLTKL